MRGLCTALLCFGGLVPQAMAQAKATAGPLLVLPDAKAHHITLFDPRTRSTVAVVPVAGWPHELAFSPDGRTGYAPSYSDAVVNAPGIAGQTIDVIDMQTYRVTATWDLGRPLRPHRPLMGADGLLYVTTELANAVAVVDPRTGKVAGEIPTGAPQTHMLLMSPDGRRLYTANLSAGSVSVLDLASRKLLRIIPVSGSIQRIRLSADGRWIYVADRTSQNVAVIDTQTETVVRRIPVGGTPFIAFPSSDGRWLLVGEDLGEEGQLEVVDLQDFAVKKHFAVDPHPYGIRIVGDEAFVTCIVSGTLEVLNLHTWTMEPPIPNLTHGDGIEVWPGLR